MDLAAEYIDIVHWFGRNGASDTVLHIHSGMAVLLAVRIATGRSLATPWPLLAVFIAALAKEFADYWAHGTIKPDTLSDIAHTIFWPAVLFMGLRVRRARQGSASSRMQQSAEGK